MSLPSTWQLSSCSPLCNGSAASSACQKGIAAYTLRYYFDAAGCVLTPLPPAPLSAVLPCCVLPPGIQFVFYFIFGNNMIAFAFLLSCFFASSKTATVFAYLVVFGTGLIGSLLLSQLINAGQWYTVLLELVPSFALFRLEHGVGHVQAKARALHRWAPLTLQLVAILIINLALFQ